MSDRILVVSTDCHAGLPIADYKPYVETKYHEMLDMAVPITVEMMDKSEEMFLIKEINDAWRAPVEQELTGAWDYRQRLNMLTKDGIAAEVIFPDGITEKNTPPFGAGLGLSPKRHGARTAVGRRHGPQSLAGRTLRQRPGAPYRGSLYPPAVGRGSGCRSGALVRG